MGQMDKLNAIVNFLHHSFLEIEDRKFCELLSYIMGRRMNKNSNFNLSENARLRYGKSTMQKKQGYCFDKYLIRANRYLSLYTF